MTNREIYSKTLTFSLHRVLVDILCFLGIAVLGTGGFILMDRLNDKGLVGLAIGVLIGLVVLYFVARFCSYTYKAGQIAMMTKAVTENELPDNVLAEGKAAVKERFTTVALFFAATRLIRGIFNEIGRGITALGSAIGGESGGRVGDAINTAISVVVGFLCDCCLGWIFFRKDVNAAKATCEGSVIFFKHGKTLLKNLGRMFGLGLLSLLLIGGLFLGIFVLIFGRFPETFRLLSAEIMEAAARSGGEASELLRDPNALMFICAAIAAVILWSIVHAVFVRPFILVGVLRNFMAAGVNDIPDEASFALLDSKSKKFQKLHAEVV